MVEKIKKTKVAQQKGYDIYISDVTADRDVRKSGWVQVRMWIKFNGLTEKEQNEFLAKALKQLQTKAFWGMEKEEKKP